jgi:transcriptional regulator with XRE-family HTH domain
LSPSSSHDMTGIELRARRKRLPGRRDSNESRSLPELAADLGYNKNTLAMLERGDTPIDRRARVLNLALRSLERDAGLVEWHLLPDGERNTLIRRARSDIKESAREFGDSPQTSKAKPARKKKGGRK